MLYNLLIHTIPFGLMIIISSLIAIHYLPVHASTESAEITQIPSEATDYTGNNNDALQILFSKATISDNDSLHVVGSVKNVGQQTLQSVKVTAHFFDADNNTVGVTTCCYADPSDIEPDHTSSFDSFSTLEEMAGDPKYYRLSFDWQNNGVNSESNIDTSAVTNNVSCKDITADFTLTSNLECSDDGLNIHNKDGITIDLNGFTLSGPGIQDNKGASLEQVNAGIRVQDSSDVVIQGPGTIKNFDAGVLNINGQSLTVSRVTFTEDEIAIFDTESTGSSIEDNLMFANDIGVAFHSSSESEVFRSLFKLNDLAGISLVNSDSNEISMNTIQGSVNGIFLDRQSKGNSVNSNNVLQSTGVDLNNANGLSVESTGNTYLDNNCNTSVPDGICLGR